MNSTISFMALGVVGLTFQNNHGAGIRPMPFDLWHSIV